MSVSSEVTREIKETSAILSGLGWPDSALAVVDADEPLMERANSLQSLEDQAATMRVATYAGMEEKRTVLRASIDHLVSQAKEPPAEISLPKGSPMGEVQVDSAKCTLCMGCVAVCPAGALLDNKERPCLSFIEWNCVQCGLCENTCPEDAIRLSARLLTDTNARMARRVLNEEEPFKCLDCGKPFTTQSMISRMEEKLSSHRMFQGEGIRKLKLCENCRVKEMFKE
jgi:ferredoxin